MPEIEFGPGGVRVDGVLMPKNAPLGWVRLTTTNSKTPDLLISVEHIGAVLDAGSRREVFARHSVDKSAVEAYVTETLDEIAAAIAAAQGGR